MNPVTMKRRLFNRSLLILPAILAAGIAAAADRPNILLVLMDDVSPDMFSCYAPFTPKGLAHAADTPHIDRLADTGVLFKTCYATAMCSPSRVELLTGRYAQATGVYQNGMWATERSRYYLEDFPTIGRLIRDAGYVTAIAGKFHEGSIAPYSEHGGFDEYCIWSSLRELAEVPGFTEWKGGMEDKVTTSRYWHPALIQNGRILDTKPSDFGPDLCNRFLMDFMQRAVEADKPFFAYWPVVAPHGTRQGMPTNPLRGEVGRMDKPDNKENLDRFASLIEYIDFLMGRTVDKIMDLGIEKETLILLVSDNGTAVTAKTRGVERGCHVVGIISGAGVRQRGPTDALMDFTDIAPTLAEITGASVPTGYRFDGKSLVPFLSGQVSSHREWIYGYISTSQLLRTPTHLLEAVNPFLGYPEGRFTYTGNHRFGEGYQRAEKLPEHARALRQMRSILAQFPPVTAGHPFWQTDNGIAFRKEYTDPDAVEKHLFNHKDWVFYDED